MQSGYILADLFVKGGLIMWPLPLTSFLALAVVPERSWFWWRTVRQCEPRRVDEALGFLENGRLQAAAKSLDGSDDFVARALRHGLNHHHGSLQSALQAAASAELERMGRFLPILDTIVTLAPLLGLLGTIFGIMHSFELMGDAQLAEPKAVTGGIAEALIATGFGLAVAIFTLIPLNFFTTHRRRPTPIISATRRRTIRPWRDTRAGPERCSSRFVSLPTVPRAKCGSPAVRAMTCWTGLPGMQCRIGASSPPRSGGEPLESWVEVPVRFELTS